MSNLKTDKNMKHMSFYLGIILILSLVGIAACIASGQNEGSPQQIELVANGWMLTIKLDGSAGIARIKESNAIFSTATVPPGAVDFGKTENVLTASLSASDSPHFEVQLQGGIRMIGQEGMVLKPIQDIAIWNQLIVQLETKWASPTLSSFKEAVKKNPLIISLPSPGQ
jgi:hypothetical protein